MKVNTKAYKVLLTFAVAAAFTLLLVGTSSPPDKINQYRVGDVIEWKQMDVTVLGMERTGDYPGLQLLPDYEFIVITVQFKNNTAYDFSFPDDPDQFFLIQDSETYIPSHMVIDKENPFIYRFSENEAAKGTYVYMIPKGKAGLILRFEHRDNGETIQSQVSLEE